MKKKKLVFATFLLGLMLITVSCKFNKKEVTTKKEEGEILKEKAEYSVSEYKLPEISEPHTILKAAKNKLYILIESEKDEQWNLYGHKQLIVYDFQNEKILKTIDFKDDLHVRNLIVDGGDIYISYMDLSSNSKNTTENTSETEETNTTEETNETRETNTSSSTNPTDSTDGYDVNTSKQIKNCIAKIEDDHSLKIIDEIFVDNLFSNFVIANGELYYDYEKDGKYGINVIKDGEPEEFFTFGNSEKLYGNIGTNGKDIFAMVTEKEGTWFYNIGYDKDVEKRYVTDGEQIFSHSFLENGVIVSYTDLGDSERTKLMYLTTKDSKKKIYNKDLYEIRGNNSDDCLMLDSSGQLHYLYIKNDTLYENLIEEFDNIQVKPITNENSRYGLVDEEQNIYMDIYFE